MKIKIDSTRARERRPLSKVGPEHQTPIYVGRYFVSVA